MNRVGLAGREPRRSWGERRLLPVAAFAPVAAVSVGLWMFSSAWLAIGLYQLVLVVAHLARGSARTPLGNLWEGDWRGVHAAGILIGAAGGVLLLAVRPWLGLPPDLGDRLSALGLDGWRWPAFMVYHAVVNAALEELFWRGDLGRPTRHPHPVDGAFALYHLAVIGPFVSPGWLPVAFVVLAGAGWFWRRLTQQSGGLRPALVSHMIADASILGAVHAMAVGF